MASGWNFLEISRLAISESKEISEIKIIEEMQIWKPESPKTNWHFC